MSPIAPSRARLLRGVLLVAAAAGSWGCWSLFLRPTGLSSWETSPILFLVMGLVTLPACLFEPAPRLAERSTALLLVANALLDSLNVVAFFAALGVTTVGIAVLTHYLAPLLVALFAPLVNREAVRGAVPAAFVATLGLALVLRPWEAPAHGAWLGAGLGALSACGYAGNVFVIRRLEARIGAARTVSWHSLLAAAILLPFASSAAIAQAGAARLGLLVVGSMTLGALSGWAFLRGLAITGTTRAAMLAYMEPLVAMIVGWLAWHETLSPLAMAGGALVLASGAWVSRPGNAGGPPTPGNAGVPPAPGNAGVPPAPGNAGVPPAR